MSILDPRQQLFLSYYTDPNSETFSNALRSALKAGYSQEYAESITTVDVKWLTEFNGNVKSLKMLEKAEKNLEKTMNIDVEDEKIGQRAVDVSKFVAERLGKSKYSTKIETEVKGNIDYKDKSDIDLEAITKEVEKKLKEKKTK